MSQSNELIDRYFAVWNERDTARRQELIAQTWAEDASYLDPLMQGEGHSGIDSMVHNVQQQFAGHQFRQLGATDAHHDRLRFSWELVSDAGSAVVAGTDFGVVAADGRLQSVTGFLDQTPAIESAE
ncbi:MAG TPA: nuclear transport factor 2 family protein [Herpetosiphonaceae bacterium]